MNLNLYTENDAEQPGWITLINPSNDRDRFSFPEKQHLKILESNAHANTETVFFFEEISNRVFLVKIFSIKKGHISGFKSVATIWSGKNCKTIGVDEFATKENVHCSIVQVVCDLQTLNAEFWRVINNGYDCVVEYTTVKLFQKHFFDTLKHSLQNGTVQKSDQL